AAPPATTASTTPTMITNLPRRVLSLYSISIEVERASRAATSAGHGRIAGSAARSTTFLVARPVSGWGYRGRYGRVVPRCTAIGQGGGSATLTNGRSISIERM